jgi:nucleotide-binding universal stress UspA family protein
MENLNWSANRIIVLTELDSLSEKMIDFAIEIARELKADEIILLNIIIPTHTQSFTATEDMFHADADLSVQMNNLLRQQNLELMENHLELFKDSDVKLTPEVIIGSSKTDLNYYLEQYNSGLLIRGIYEDNSWFGKLFEPDTDKIARKVDYPVILFKDNTVVKSLSKIGVAIDVENKQKESLKIVSEFGFLLEARLELFYILTRDDLSEEKAILELENIAKENNMQDYSTRIIKETELEAGIDKYLRTTNANMIAVLSKGKGKLKNLFYGSSSEKIFHESDLPVLICSVH